MWTERVAMQASGVGVLESGDWSFWGDKEGSNNMQTSTCLHEKRLEGVVRARATTCAMEDEWFGNWGSRTKGRAGASTRLQTASNSAI
jgi:hypothetical protein